MPREAILGKPTSHEDTILETPVSPLSSPLDKQNRGYRQPQTVLSPGLYGQNLEKRNPAAEHLHRQGYIVWLVLVYAVMLITSWSILVVTSKHPLGRSSYGCFYEDKPCPWTPEDLAYQNDRTVRYITNAQTLLSAVSLLTIPLTSAVCAAAVVPWLQQSGKGMSLRQITTLADKGWTSPYIYYRLLLPTGWKRYGSSFIALALLLHAGGAALSPAISQMSSLVPVRVSGSSSAPSVENLISLNYLFGSDGYNDPMAVLRLRESLKTVAPTQIQSRLWVPHTMNYSANTDWYLSTDLPVSSQCTASGMTYLSLPSEPEAWVSQLGYGFTTGFRLAMSVELIGELPSQCNPKDAALLLNYAGTSTEIDTLLYDWPVKVSILAVSSFNNTNNAQTLVETAYLDLYTYQTGYNILHNVSKITMSTTIGYFELPNYNNNNAPGALLPELNLTSTYGRLRRQLPQPYYTLTLEENVTQSQSVVATRQNKGPLMNTIYALFGNGSLPSIYTTENATYSSGVPFVGYENGLCVDIVPLTMLVDAYSPNNGSAKGSRGTCLSPGELAQGFQMHSFLGNFFIPIQALERVFRAAAYISHDIWLSGRGVDLNSGVQYDAGRDLQKPGLDDRSITALTIAIAVFLLSLLMLAFYASFSKTWTSNLDAYALLRIGAGLGNEALPFLVIRDAHQIGELDELPGWVGDVTEGDEVGPRELGMSWSSLGARQVKPVKNDALYLSYPKMSERGRFDLLCHWCNAVCGLGGLRRTKAGQKVKKARFWLLQVKIVRRWMRMKGYSAADDKPAYESLGRSPSECC